MSGARGSNGNHMEPSLSSIFFQPAGLLSACLVFSRKGPTVQLAALAGEFCMVNVSTLMITMSGGHPLGVTLQPSVMLSRMHSSVIYSTAADLLITWRTAVMLTTPLCAGALCRRTWGSNQLKKNAPPINLEGQPSACQSLNTCAQWHRASGACSSWG